MRIHVAIPAYGQTVHTACCASLTRLVRHFERRAIANRLSFLSDALVNRVRNVMVANFLADAKATHLLMVDSDMGFEPSTIQRLLDRDVPIAGVAYPRRTYDWTRAVGRTHATVDELQARVSKFVVTLERGTAIVDGFAKASYVGTGLLLLQRRALEQMADALAGDGALTLDIPIDPGSKPWVRGYFEPIPHGPEGTYLAEDYAFCQRWRDLCGGEIWCDLTAVVTHTGPVEFKGSYLEAMRYRPRKPRIRVVQS